MWDVGWGADSEQVAWLVTQQQAQALSLFSFFQLHTSTDRYEIIKRLIDQ